MIGMNTPNPLQSPARQQKPPQRPQQNPHEQLERTDTDSNHLKAAAKQVGDVPGQIVSDIKDSFVASLYGITPSELAARRSESEKKQDSFTKLNFERLQEAYARNDSAAAEQIQKQLADHQQFQQEHKAAHKAYASEVEKAIHERKKEEQERQQAIAEEEERKRQEEQQAHAAQADMGGGQGKSKAQLGAPRKKASTDTNFEAGQGKNGK